MIELTEEQQQALDAHPGAPLPMTDGRDNTSYVLIRAELYERMKALMEEGDFDVRAMYTHMARVFGPAGWDDPAMDVYNDLDPRRKS